MLPGEGLHWQVCVDALNPVGLLTTNPLGGVSLYLQKAAEGKQQNKPSPVFFFICVPQHHKEHSSPLALPPPFVCLPPTSTQRERASDFNMQQYSGSAAPAHTAQSADGAPGKFSL